MRDNYKQAFEQLKALIVIPPGLKYYDLTKPVALLPGTSSERQILVRKSSSLYWRHLSKAERYHAEVEKETLVWLSYVPSIYKRKTCANTSHETFGLIFRALTIDSNGTCRFSTLG